MSWDRKTVIHSGVFVISFFLITLTFLTPWVSVSNESYRQPITPQEYSLVELALFGIITSSFYAIPSSVLLLFITAGGILGMKAGLSLKSQSVLIFLAGLLGFFTSLLFYLLIPFFLPFLVVEINPIVILEGIFSISLISLSFVIHRLSR